MVTAIAHNPNGNSFLLPWSEEEKGISFVVFLCQADPKITVGIWGGDYYPI